MADMHSAISAAMATPPVAPTAPEAAKPVAKAPEPPKAKVEPTAAQKKIWKLKADGEEFDFDATDEEAVKREVMKARGANKRFEEAAKARKEADAQRKEAEEAFAMLKDPAQLKKLLADPRIGGDFKKLAEEYLWEQIQEERLTPEQRHAKEVERELAKYKDQEKSTKAQQEAAEAAQMQAHYEADYEQKIMSALEVGGVPKTKGAVRRMAHYLELALRSGMDVTTQDLVQRVRQDLVDEHREMYGASEAHSLIGILGEDLAKKLRQADVKRLKSTQPTPRAAGISKPSPRDKPPQRKKIDRDDIAAGLAERFKNGF